MNSLNGKYVSVYRSVTEHIQDNTSVECYKSIIMSMVLSYVYFLSTNYSTTKLSSLCTILNLDRVTCYEALLLLTQYHYINFYNNTIVVYDEFGEHVSSLIRIEMPPDKLNELIAYSG